MYIKYQNITFLKGMHGLFGQNYIVASTFYLSVSGIIKSILKLIKQTCLN